MLAIQLVGRSFYLPEAKHTVEANLKHVMATYQDVISYALLRTGVLLDIDARCTATALGKCKRMNTCTLSVFQVQCSAFARSYARIPVWQTDIYSV